MLLQEFYYQLIENDKIPNIVWDIAYFIQPWKPLTAAHDFYSSCQGASETSLSVSTSFLVI